MLPIELQNPPYVLVKWVENCEQPFNSTNKISKFRPDKVHYDLLGPTLVNSNKKIQILCCLCLWLFKIIYLAIPVEKEI